MIISFLKKIRSYPNRRLFAFAHDAGAAAFAFMAALYLRLGDDVLSFAPLFTTFKSLSLFVFSCVFVFVVSGLYRRIWAFASVRDLVEIVRASTIAVLLYVLLGFIVMRLEDVPRTVPVIAWFVLILSLGGTRFLFRLARERRLSALWERSGNGRVNILIVGAGDETDIFIRAVSSNPQAPYRIVGVLDENDQRVGRLMNGVEILGTIEEFASVIENLRGSENAPSRVILTHAMTRMHGDLVSRLLEQAPSLGVNISRIPDLTELRDDMKSGAGMHDRPIALEDLLGRPETVLKAEEISELISGRAVLVTGAGGSIGSELVRQIAARAPKKLVLLELSEFNLYRIELEIREKHPSLPVHAIIADVRDAPRLSQIFREQKPALVFHAAAIKHVPIAEENAREALMTNVIGSRNVADCALKSGAVAMVQISTDKAVNPTNVMGATKRLAEMYCQALDLASPTTRFVTVRFGNVLGSTGSVVPRFQEQLAKGGPLTVTHPDIMRFFMTIREAVELVLQASTLGVKSGDQRGKVLVLDMGRPVKIADLARQVIRLAGLRPDEDIQITYTGLRKGEKLYEELFATDEEPIPSDVDGVRLAKSRTVELTQLQQALSNFALQLQAGLQDEPAIQHLKELVPEFDHHIPASNVA